MAPSVITVVVLIEFAIISGCLSGQTGGGWTGGGGGGYTTSFQKTGPPVRGSIGSHGSQGWSGGHEGGAGNSGWSGGYDGGSGGWSTGSNGGGQESWKGGEEWKPYHFGYQTHSHDATTAREEKTDEHGRVSGYYTLMTADGRNRKVSYVADEHGFRAKVDTNEPGTASQDPASVHFHSSAPKVVHPPSGHNSGHGGSWSGGSSGGYGGGNGGWEMNTNINHGGWNGGGRRGWNKGW